MKRSYPLAFAVSTAVLAFAAIGCGDRHPTAPNSTQIPQTPVPVNPPDVATGSQTVSRSLPQAATLSLRPTASDCQNNPGPTIRLDGELKLSGVNARVILTNNARFTHVGSQDVVADAVIIPAGEAIQINKQPSRGGVGGNPWIYLQFADCNGNNLGAPQKLGRCVQGLNEAALNFNLPTGASMTVTSGGCSNRPGPFITLDGELKLGGLCAKLIFTNNAKLTHATTKDVTVDIELLPAGKSVVFSKQPNLGGAGGNPWIYVQFLNGVGAEMSAPILIGRCNDIG